MKNSQLDSFCRETKEKGKYSFPLYFTHEQNRDLEENYRLILAVFKSSASPLFYFSGPM
jgi:hypothetical protein